ncbi:MAG: hypothetical protein ACR2F6_12860 [Mycobacteriales bacterium]
MAILTEFFAAVDDAAATEFLTSGARDGAESVFETTGLTSNELDILHAQLAGTDVRKILRSGGGGMLAYVGDEGPWVERIRPDLVRRVAALRDDDLPTVADRWVSDDDLDDVDAAHATGVLRGWRRLAVEATTKELSLYLWTSL